MLTEKQVRQYHDDGYLAVPDVLSGDEGAALQRVTDEMVEASRSVGAHTEAYDLEPSHSAQEPNPSFHPPRRSKAAIRVIIWNSAALICAASEAGATIVGETFHRFQPVGVTGILAIAESHMGVHTWPEYGFAAVDIFTCGEGFSPHKAAELLIDRFECANPTLKEVRRGFIERRVVSPVRVPQ